VLLHRARPRYRRDQVRAVAQIQAKDGYRFLSHTSLLLVKRIRLGFPAIGAHDRLGRAYSSTAR
jgi:hypothetical protein